MSTRNTVVVEQVAPKPLLARLLDDHLSLLVSAAIAVLVTLKISAFSRFDPQTAAGVVQVSGTADVLVGTFVSMLPMLFVLALGELLLRRGSWYRSLQSVERSAVRAAVALPISWLALSIPIAFAVIYLGLVLLVPALLGWFVRRASIKDDLSVEPTVPISRTESAAVQVGFPIYVIFLVATAAWLPTESVSVDGAKPVKAYVIGTRGEETVFLPAGGSKGLETAPTRRTKRDYCSDTSWFDASVLDLLSGPRYPRCP